MGSPFVVIVTPSGDDSPGLEQVLEPADAKTFFAQLAVEALHIGILRGLARLDVHQIDLAIQRPGKEVTTGQLWPIAPREVASWSENLDINLSYTTARSCLLLSPDTRELAGIRSAVAGTHNTSQYD
jgi:hypothetical protein